MSTPHDLILAQAHLADLRALASPRSPRAASRHSKRRFARRG